MVIPLAMRRKVLARRRWGRSYRAIAAELKIGREAAGKIVREGKAGLRRWKKRHPVPIVDPEDLLPRRYCDGCGRRVGKGPCLRCRVMAAVGLPPGFCRPEDLELVAVGVAMVGRRLARYRRARAKRIKRTCARRGAGKASGTRNTGKASGTRNTGGVNGTRRRDCPATEADFLRALSAAADALLRPRRGRPGPVSDTAAISQMS
jgi:hypothetical protein